MKSDKLLGIYFQDDLKWSEYIQNHDKSLTTRLSAIKIISRVANFKVRLMIANGIFISKLIFQISLWGGAEGYLLQSLQVVQNRAARIVTRRGRYKYSPAAELLKQCGWLSVRQFAVYQTCELVYKVLEHKYPQYNYKMLSSEYSRDNRQAAKQEKGKMVTLLTWN